MANGRKKPLTSFLTDELEGATLAPPELLSQYSPGFETAVGGQTTPDLPGIITPEAAEQLSPEQVETIRGEVSGAKTSNILSALAAIGMLAAPGAALPAALLRGSAVKQKKSAERRVRAAEEKGTRARAEDLAEREFESTDMLNRAKAEYYRAQAQALGGEDGTKDIEWEKAASAAITRETKLELSKLSTRREFMGVPTELPMPTAIVDSVRSRVEEDWARRNQKGNPFAWQIVNPERRRVRELKDDVDNYLQKKGRSQKVYDKMLRTIRTDPGASDREKIIAEEYLDYRFLDAIEWAKKYRGLGATVAAEGPPIPRGQ